MLAKLDHIIQEAENISTFFFKPQRPLRFVAGQFIEMTLPHASPDNRGVKRWFTISSSPNHELISITTKHAEKPSSFKQKLWQLEPGQEVEISEPMGDFVLPKDSSVPLIFVAGGIGITPFHSIVSWLIDNNQTREIKFIYSVKTEEEIIFSQTFDQDFIDKTLLVNEANLTASKIIGVSGDIDGKQVFISGPEPMTEAIVKQFNDLDVTQDQLITDYFPGYPA